MFRIFAIAFAKIHSASLSLCVFAVFFRFMDIYTDLSPSIRIRQYMETVVIEMAVVFGFYDIATRQMEWKLCTAIGFLAFDATNSAARRDRPSKRMTWKTISI